MKKKSSSLDKNYDLMDSTLLVLSIFYIIYVTTMTMRLIEKYLLGLLLVGTVACQTTSTNRSNSNGEDSKKTIVLREGIAEHLGEIDMEQSVIITSIAINTFTDKKTKK